MIDNRASHGGLLEAATTTCSHCQRQVVRNPARERVRAYCPKCDHYICDGCENARVQSGGECITFNEIADTIMNKAVHGEHISNPQMLIARSN